MPDLLAALDAFLQEHRAGVDECLVWMACDCGAKLVQVLDEPSKDKYSSRVSSHRRYPPKQHHP